MIELRDDRLVFSCPDVHAEARLTIEFQRTLRIPDDDSTYGLPPGIGQFPLRHVDDCTGSVPAAWTEHGGVMLPMYQSEAMWLCFSSNPVPGRGADYPFAVKIAAGKINAVSGGAWSAGLHLGPQDYVVAPTQPWLDGFCVEKGTIRQFVAMPLGSGYSAEEQITGKAEHGGLQILAYPMKRDVFERRFPKREWDARADYDDGMIACSMSEAVACAAPDMGLAPGGRMKQEIYDDPFDINDWDLDAGSRCFVHLANSLVWRAITGEAPPTTPPTAAEYTRAGLPWFDYYADGRDAVEGSDALAKLKSVLEMGKAKGDVPLPENESVKPERVVVIQEKPAPHVVREEPF